MLGGAERGIELAEAKADVSMDSAQLAVDLRQEKGPPGKVGSRLAPVQQTGRVTVSGRKAQPRKGDGREIGFKCFRPTVRRVAR